MFYAFNLQGVSLYAAAEGYRMTDQIDNVELATELTIAWLGNNNTRVSADDVPAFLKQMHSALNQLSQPETSSATSEAAVEE